MPRKNESADTAVKKNYVVVQGNLLHSHQMFRKDDPVQLTADEAAPLLENGTIKEK